MIKIGINNTIHIEKNIHNNYKKYKEKVKPPLQASIKERRAKTESTRTGSSESCILDTTHCKAFRKLF